jgi:hypothetical protein
MPLTEFVGGLEKKNKIVTPGEKKQLLSMRQDTPQVGSRACSSLIKVTIVPKVPVLARHGILEEP